MAQYELLIHARRAVVDGRIQQAAVTVDGGVISSVRTGSEARDIGLAGDHTIALGDDVVLMPGLVDPHVSTEDVAVGTRSAAQGGITTVVDYGTDGDPVAVNAEDVDRWRELVTGESTVDVGLWGAAVPGNLGRLGEVLDTGVFGVSAVASGKGVEGAPTLDSAQLVAAAEEVAGAGGLFAVDAGVGDLPGLLEVCGRTGGRLQVRAPIQARARAQPPRGSPPTDAAPRQTAARAPGRGTCSRACCLPGLARGSAPRPASRPGPPAPAPTGQSAADPSVSFRLRRRYGRGSHFLPAFPS